MSKQQWIVSLLFSTAPVVVWLVLRERTVGHAAASTGESFAVKQSWNGALDGYITEIVCYDRYGRQTTTTLDGDDSRSSFVPLTVNETTRSVSVALSGGREMRVTY